MEMIIFLLCVIMAFGALSAYLYADVRSHKRFIAKLTELIDVEKAEKNEALSRLFVKHGSKPLGYKPSEKPPEPINRFITKAEAASRQNETVEKAKEILSK